MQRFIIAIVFAGAAALPMVAQAEGGDGSRQAAGGGFMSSYVNDPYHDPRSLHSQRMGSGQILGQPMLSEGAGVHGGAPSKLSRRNVVDPHWAAGTLPRRAR